MSVLKLRIIGQFSTRQAACSLFTLAGLFWAAHSQGADLVPVRIEAREPEAQPTRTPPTPLQAVAVSDDIPAAMEEFDVVTAEELSRTPAEPSPTLSAATKARMFTWQEAEHYRAGCPELLRHFTMLSSNNRYVGYQVGGGSPVIGTGPTIYEGTWGLDYQGFFPKKVALNWNRGRREQGGTGAYKTDGPKLKE